MHLFIATDGSLDTDKTVDLVTRLHEPGDTVTVFTAIHFPKTFLQNYAEIGGADNIAAIADAGGSQLSSGAKAAEHLTGGSHREADPRQVTKTYFETVAEKCGGPLKDALGAAGIDADLLWIPTENQTARTIIAEANLKKADVLVAGSHGQGGFEGPLGSTVTKLVRRATIPVLLVR